MAITVRAVGQVLEISHCDLSHNHSVSQTTQPQTQTTIQTQPQTQIQSQGNTETTGSTILDDLDMGQVCDGSMLPL